ncbi:transglutaminase family protein [Vibrio viridaestus]|uniref:Transglutaminase family protein n=1 Tax=Vibrio viridaestus TaxID=2487322 RepID=A0A3N9U2F1_9VIBR|nr:transglutaminase family protein [Vibrio viridaestus]RQW63682.1 transglutaminase family protein [Vibrio viridaestus]
MKYRVRHTTEYQYNAPVTLCYNMTHLLPRDTTNQRCLSRRIQVYPQPTYQREGNDYFGNTVFYFSLQEAHKRLTIDVTSYFDIQKHKYESIIDTFPLTCGELREQMVLASTADIRLAKEYCLNSQLIRRSDELAQYVSGFFTDQALVLSATKAFMHHIFTDFKFDATATNVTTAPEQVLKEKKGVCQDFAHFAIACLRSVGIPARYMSGYIETLPPPGQEKLVGADASHAWFAIFVPELGWVEFDPTNDLIPAEQHIVTAWGRDYADVTPIQGVIFDGGDSQNLKVSVDVSRV